MRIDQLLVQRGLASTRSQAQRLIAGGVLWQQGELWRKVVKNGDLVPDDAALQLQDDAEARYVSRGGLKLEAALQQVGLDVAGWQCLDVGQSTGGFTDCLLQRGARGVVGVDVGSAQLHPKLASDARVLSLEGVNARTLTASDLIAASADETRAGGQFDAELVPEFELIVADLSFISQTLVLPALVPLLKIGGRLLTLAKPQFELQPGQVGKGGIVKDAAMYAVVEQRLRQACATLGLTVTHWFDSPLTGGDGNHEFFMAASKA
ncbi:MAG: TlyA family RNA methyltransferase [Rhodoferax sp.]|nr:TlyA family RNA methyltransferase [Rhodoferax sp.]